MRAIDNHAIWFALLLSWMVAVLHGVHDCAAVDQQFLLERGAADCHAHVRELWQHSECSGRRSVSHAFQVSASILVFTSAHIFWVSRGKTFFAFQSWLSHRLGLFTGLQPRSIPFLVLVCVFVVAVRLTKIFRFLNVSNE